MIAVDTNVLVYTAQHGLSLQSPLSELARTTAGDVRALVCDLADPL